MHILYIAYKISEYSLYSLILVKIVKLGKLQVGLEPHTAFRLSKVLKFILLNSAEKKCPLIFPDISSEVSRNLPKKIKN